MIVAGTALMTFGFFVAHAVASGWVAARASLSAGGPGQAASLYLLAYYGGSSVVGALAGTAWSRGGWPGVVLLTGALAGVSLLVAVALVRTRSFAPPAP